MFALFNAVYNSILLSIGCSNKLENEVKRNLGKIVSNFFSGLIAFTTNFMSNQQP